METKKHFTAFLRIFLSLTVVFAPATAIAQGPTNPVALAHAPVCPGPSKDAFNCHARVVVDGKGSPQANPAPAGLSPQQLRAAYGVTGRLANGTPNTIIAIVDAYDHPNILNDLNTYSAQFSIPGLASCNVSTATSSAPCFQKVDQRGGTKYPRTDAGWALEIALDVESAHAMCENCSILLVEADNNSYTNLMAAVDQAYTKGAKVVSNSYGSGEFSGETSYDFHFNHPGVAYTVSSGDSGYGAQYPAASRFVTAVGGTTLNMNGTTLVSETAWSGAGSGCSAYESKPAFQTDTGCSRRSIADVSAVANPSTGAAVYDSVRYSGKSGWFRVGGTSLAAPVVAGVYALSQNFGNNVTPANSLPYAKLGTGALRDINIGSNGSCSVAYLCNAQVGYDGPTGVGTPIGTTAF